MFHRDYSFGVFITLPHIAYTASTCTYRVAFVPQHILIMYYACIKTQSAIRVLLERQQHNTEGRSLSYLLTGLLKFTKLYTTRMIFRRAYVLLSNRFPSMYPLSIYGRFDGIIMQLARNARGEMRFSIDFIYIYIWLHNDVARFTQHNKNKQQRVFAILLYLFTNFHHNNERQPRWRGYFYYAHFYYNIYL